MSLEYKTSIKESDLISDMVKSLEGEFYTLNRNQHIEIAQATLEKIKKEGNGVVYRSLLKVCIEEASLEYRNHVIEYRERWDKSQ